MSRCFPYPQPGYEKKARDLSVVLSKDLKRGKDKKKKKKKKKDREEKRRRSGDEKSLRRHVEGGEHEKERETKPAAQEGRDADRGSKRQKTAAITDAHIRCNGEISHEDADIRQHPLKLSPKELYKNHVNGTIGEGGFVSGCHDFGNASVSGHVEEDHGYVKPQLDEAGGQGDRGFEPPVLPTDEPPGGRGADGGGEEADEEWWLFRGRDWPPREPAVKKAESELAKMALVRVEPRYLAEFDVCILPYVVPF